MDAIAETKKTFEQVMAALHSSLDTAIASQPNIYGVECRLIKFGDLFHIDNLIERM